MYSKYFTPKEANKRLPLVKQIVEDILGKGQIFLQLLNEQKKGEKMSAECIALEEEIKGLILELEDLGCMYNDWDFKVGLVDFPAIIDGQEVLLCWRSDESEVLWYHSEDENYESRILIPPNLLN